MRTIPLFAVVLLFSGACQTANDLQPRTAPVRSFADLPTDYQPILEGSVIPGKLKQETHAGQVVGEWRYNQQGQLTEGRRYLSGQVTNAHQYRYDAAGRLRYIQHFDNGCGYSSSSSCSGPLKWTGYDEVDADNAGRVQESRTFLQQSGQWQLRTITTYEYNSNGQPTKLLRYDNTRKLASTQDFSYDNRGNIISVRERNNDPSPDLADRTFQYEYTQALNPYAGTIHYVVPFFSSRYLQLIPGSTYEYAANGAVTRIRENNTVTELTYY